MFHGTHFLSDILFCVPVKLPDILDFFRSLLLFHHRNTLHDKRSNKYKHLERHFIQYWMKTLSFTSLIIWIMCFHLCQSETIKYKMAALETVQRYGTLHTYLLIWLATKRESPWMSHTFIEHSLGMPLGWNFHSTDQT